MAQLQRWADGATRSPAEKVRRERMRPAAISCRVRLDSPGLPHLSGRATSARTEHTGGSPHGQSKESGQAPQQAVRRNAGTAFVLTA